MAGGRHESSLHRQALENFREEIEANRRHVAGRLTYHRTMREGFQQLVIRPPLASIEAAFDSIGFKGTRWSLPSETAMRAAEVTGALGLRDLDLAGAVLDAYGTQQLLLAVQQDFLGTYFDPTTWAEENIQGGLISRLTYFQTVVELENALVENLYPRALAAVESALGEAPSEGVSAPPLAPPDSTGVDSPP